MSDADLTDREKDLLELLQETGEELQRYRCGDNRALRTVREMRGQTEDDK